MLKKAEKEKTPKKLIQDRFDRLIKNPFFYNKEIFDENKLNSYEIYILSDRISTFSVAQGNRLLLSHVISTDVIREFILPEIESFNRIIDDDDNTEYQDSTSPEPHSDTSQLDEVLKTERMMSIHNLLGKLFEDIHDDDILEELIYRKELLKESWTKISSDLNLPRSTLYGNYQERFQEIKETFQEKYMDEFKKIFDSD